MMTVKLMTDATGSAGGVEMVFEATAYTIRRPGNGSVVLERYVNDMHYEHIIGPAAEDFDQCFIMSAHGKTIEAIH